MSRTGVRHLLELARAEPREALERGGELLDTDEALPAADLSTVYRAMAIAARLAEYPVPSTQLAERAVEAAERSGEASLLVDALMTMAGSQAIAGANHEALQALHRAQGIASGHQLAEVKFQMGSVRARMGDGEEARALFTDVLPVFAAAGDEESMAMTLNNRGMLNLFASRLGEALEDFEKARDIDRRIGLDTALASVEHNIGSTLALMGDIPRALEMLDASEGRLRELDAAVAEIQVSRVEVLLAAGLFTEAMLLAEELVVELGRLGLAGDQAEAMLAGAVASRLAGHPDAGKRLGQRAAALFAQQGREAWERSARQVVLASRLDLGLGDRPDYETAISLAGSLEADGLSDAAFSARLTAGLIALAIGAPDLARGALREIAGTADGPLHRQLDSIMARALLLELDEDSTGAERAARDGFQLLDEFQAVVGASDVRAGLEGHVTRLGQLGRRLAAGLGDPRLLWDWAELTRARSIRFRPVTPDTDEEQAADLSSLRQLQVRIRNAAPDEAVELSRLKQAIEDSIRDRTRHAAVADLPLGHVDVLSRLADTVVVELVEVDGDIWSVTADKGEIASRPLASADEITRDARHLRFDMKRLARGLGSLEPAHALLSRLDGLLFDGLSRDVEPLVLVPTPGLYALPWSAMPSLAERPVILAPSAEMHVRAAAAPHRSGGVHVFAGPDLTHAHDEAGAVRAVHGLPGHTSSSSVARVLEDMEGASITHLVAHARFVADNPMFSSVRLDDGELHVYDIERLGRAPAVVVLSACDSGFTETRPGEELLGLSASLLAMGTRTVIASVGLVPDSPATADLMIALHRGLAAGLSPSDALSRSQQDLSGEHAGFVAAASFVCIGAG